MNRIKKLQLNSFFSVLSKVAILVSGLILPRLIISNYGSEINGLVASVTQFLIVITFLELGVGTVVQSALYKPLANDDNLELNQVLNAARRYFRNISYILIVYILILIIIFPFITEPDNISIFSTTLLIIAIAISRFAQYYFGMVNEILLNADQKSYLQYISEIVVVVLNLILSVVMIRLNFSIEIVKLLSGLVFLIRPVYLNYYVKHNYKIIVNLEETEDPLPQKWNGMAQHIAFSIQNSTDIVILTVFSTLEFVSIYSVYNMVASSMNLLISSLTTGLNSFFGNLIANNESNLLNNYFSKIEWGVHRVVVLLYGITACLIEPFVELYTSGVKDVNYSAPIFALILVIGKAFNSLRIPYQSIAFSAGHFRQTQLSSYIDASINIIITLVLVNHFGLIGVAIGSLIASIYRTTYFAYYLTANILNRPVWTFIKQCLVDIVIFASIIISGSIIQNYISIISISGWILNGVILVFISTIIILIIDLFLFNNMIKFAFRKIKRK